jgi:hypothetical protein
MSSLASRLSERARRQIVESQLEPEDAIDRVLDFWVEQEPSNLFVTPLNPCHYKNITLMPVNRTIIVRFRYFNLSPESILGASTCE